MTEIIASADRLYGIDFLPQELALHGGKVDFTLRYSPIYDDPAQTATEHFSVLVLEVLATVPGEADTVVRRRLLRCGWEFEQTTATAIPVGTLPEQREDVRRLLEKIASTVNDLAGRAGLPSPMTDEIVTTLLHHYRSGAAANQTQHA